MKILNNIGMFLWIVCICVLSIFSVILIIFIIKEIVGILSLYFDIYTASITLFIFLTVLTFTVLIYAEEMYKM